MGAQKSGKRVLATRFLPAFCKHLFPGKHGIPDVVEAEIQRSRQEWGSDVVLNEIARRVSGRGLASEGRKILSDRYLDRVTVASIVQEEMTKAEYGQPGKKKSAAAKEALQKVNAALAESAKKAGLQERFYKNKESLLSAYAAMLKSGIISS